jgi:hypothetical protein
MPGGDKVFEKEELDRLLDATDDYEPIRRRVSDSERGSSA